MRYNTSISAFAISASVLAAAVAPAMADGYTASRKAEPAPVAAAAEPSRGPCYVRADVGYGWSAGHDATATATPSGGFGSATGDVQGTSFDGAWFGEVGFGCSIVRQSMVGGSIKDQPMAVSSPTGLRGDITFGFHGSRDFSGIPVMPPAPIQIIDPVHAKVSASTLMFNLYYDLPQMQGFTPYVGAGIGMAFVDLKNTTFTDGFIAQPGNVSETNLAWSLMAGVARQLGGGMVLDVGYRYLNMGDIGVTNASLGYSLKLQDLSEHQVKVGLRIPVDFGR